MLIRILGITLLAVTFNGAHAENYLTEKPNVLEPCSVDDVNLNVCLGKSIQDIFINWNDGIPGGDIFRLTDPFSVDGYKSLRTILSPDNTTVEIIYELKNFVIKGLSQATSSIKYIPFSYLAAVSVEIPKLSLNFDLKVTIINGSTITDYEDTVRAQMNMLVGFHVYLKPRVTPQATFFDVERIRIGLHPALDYSIKLDKIDTDGKELDDTVFEAFRNEKELGIPVLFKVFDREWAEKLLVKRVQKILDYIPANYIIADVK